jgi:hypothetical protein
MNLEVKNCGAGALPEEETRCCVRLGLTYPRAGDSCRQEDKEQEPAPVSIPTPMSASWAAEALPPASISGTDLCNSDSTKDGASQILSKFIPISSGKYRMEGDSSTFTFSVAGHLQEVMAPYAPLFTLDLCCKYCPLIAWHPWQTVTFLGMEAVS